MTNFNRWQIFPEIQQYEKETLSIEFDLFIHYKISIFRQNHFYDVIALVDFLFLFSLLRMLNLKSLNQFNLHFLFHLEKLGDIENNASNQ